MHKRQFVTPLLVRNGHAEELTRIPFDERFMTERSLQNLLYEHPCLIPIGEIEPMFEGLLSVASELPTGCGPLDLLFMNSKGYLTLVETKLWRNPEARRIVIAQILDYAKHMSSWTFETITAAVCASRDHAPGDNPLIDLARTEDDDFDEREFIDRMNRNLRHGRFVLLIVGDGIQEGVEQMADFLNQTPQLDFRLGLVEMGLYRVGSDRSEFFVQPRLLTRTREVIRAVVEITTTVEPTKVIVSVPTADTNGGGRSRITEDAFYSALGGMEQEPGQPEPKVVVAFARKMLSEAANHGLDVEWGDAGPLLRYVEPQSGEFFTLGQLHRNGRLGSTNRLTSRFRKLGLPKEIYQGYLDCLAGFIPGATRRTFGSATGREWEQVAMNDSAKLGTAPLGPLVDHADDWLRLIDVTTERIREAMAAREVAQ